jgi:hypothetical protein
MPSISAVRPANSISSDWQRSRTRTDSSKFRIARSVIFLPVDVGLIFHLPFDFQRTGKMVLHVPRRSCRKGRGKKSDANVRFSFDASYNSQRNEDRLRHAHSSRITKLRRARPPSSVAVRRNHARSYPGPCPKPRYRLLLSITVSFDHPKYSSIRLSSGDPLVVRRRTSRGLIEATRR